MRQGYGLQQRKKKQQHEQSQRESERERGTKEEQKGDLLGAVVVINTTSFCIMRGRS